MRVVLGIDTGGTYTDAVIYDREQDELIDKNKALTTHYNLTEGINNCIGGLKQEWFERIEIVSLSTTLATNAIVESNGARVGLLLLGYDQELIEQFKLDEKIPAERIGIVAGRFNIKGKEVEALNIDRIKELGLAWKDKVDVLAVSGYMSVRNPAHEIEAKKILGKLTNLPVVCGHILTNKLNSIKRATTVVLNASLIPIIKDLNDKTKKALQAKGIEAPLLVVKGDGSLLKDKVILKRPIETILSGPAASTIGAKKLAEVEDGIIVDMGGTTTDICLIEDGRPKLDPTGAVIEGWSSSIEAIKFKTSGLGGDSRIFFNQERKLDVGPKRVIPYSVAATKDDGVLIELEKMNRRKVDSQQREFLILNRIPDNISFSKEEKRLIKLLEGGPKSLRQITNELDIISNKFLKVKSLERLEVIKRIGLTPTDILHVLNKYDKWNNEAAELGFNILVDEMLTDGDALAVQITDDVIKKSAKEIANYLITQEYDNYEDDKCEICESLLNLSINNISNNFNWDFKPKLPIIAIGAPAQAYLKDLDRYLHTDVILPQNYEVANAIGAAVGSILIEEEILIKPNPMQGNHIMHHTTGKEEFIELDEAITYAKDLGKRIAINKVKEAGAIDWEVDLEVEKKEIGLNSKFSGTLLEVKVIITVIGSPYVRN
ncbi:hydantoinase/oxoprolinase family protein [Selenihalanaerobacter shriftii]|uniref:N-methylhydantoinase A/oxoprolinase/acetone carboxylase, beta subunit n=1 Tax=Selenihalanaerobacter shriftii TaxID=142842 RepID=A0A1T4MQM6_9FIRM|nr:hydantoinase/oxoprolinase family protein [Selenihalanaerobacter shriftii]SJZ69171.1 N-methylhydantoinase A/oxoprolinase/acetone carboxylase, beta subunit [Selenihalanaerobacter shriftii]